MRKYLMILIAVIIMLSGCGINTEATILPDSSASSSVSTKQVTMKGTKDGIDSFLSLYDYKSAYKDDECFNITPDTVRQSGYSVFKYNESCASFLLYAGEVYPLCTSIGGNGVVSMAISDLDKDGKPELYFTFSLGSGIHRSQAGYFDPNTKQVTIFDFAYWNKDMMISDNGSGLKLYSVDFTSFSGFTDYTMQAGEYIADIVYDGNGIKLETAEGTPVSTQAMAPPSPSQSSAPETMLILYAGGKRARESVITDDTGKQIVKNAVFDYLIRNAALPAVNIDELSDYIEIHYQLGDDMEGMPSVYYAFEKDGKHCIQSDKRYSYISDDSYALLYKLASGI